MVNSGAQLSIAEGTTFGVSTDFLNTGNLNNRGNIFLKGNWMNVGVYNAPSGQLTFNSTQPQQIMNSGQVIDRLVISNGIKTLDDDLIITKELSLNSALLVVNEEARLTLGQGVLITGASDDAFIVGKLYRQGTGDLFFPIGTANKYLPVALTEVIGINPEIGMTAFDSAPPQDAGDDLDRLYGENYWRLEADENYTAGFITLPYNVGTFTADTTNLVIGQAVNAESDFNTLGKSSLSFNDGQGTITSGGNAIGRYFTLAVAPEDAPLPPLRVINVLTPLQDGKHDFLRIENIELYPDNQVEIFDRGGAKVFSISNYDNRDRVFRGIPNVGSIDKLQDGNYYYTIKTGKTKVKAGFLFLKN
ncbi:MAG: hypothetical protein Tsb0034_23200 [Ekhidna sp.]